MITSVVSPAPVFSTHSQLDENGKGAISSLLSRFSFSINWEKALVFSNVALITAGIAYGFFMRLPAIMVGLAAYGIFYLLLRGKVQQSRPDNIYELRAELQVKERENKELTDKLEANLQGGELADNIRQQVAEDRRQLEALSAKRAREEAKYSKKKDKLRSEIKRLEADKRDLQRTIGDYRRA